MRMWVLILLWLVVPAWAQTVMIGDVQGSASVAGVQLKALDKVDVGQEITLGPGARVTVMFQSDGLRQRLEGPGVGKVTNEGITPKSLVSREVRPRKRQSARVPEGLNLDRMAAIRTRVVNTDESRESLALMGVPQYREKDATVSRAVMETTPRFSWLVYDDTAFSSYELVVFGHSKVEVNSETSLRLEKPLERGEEYQVMLTGVRDDGTRSVPSVITYRVLSQEQADWLAEYAEILREEFRVAPDDPSPMLVLASVYAENELLSQALSTLGGVLELRPEDQNLRLALGDLYLESGMTDRARECYRLAGVR